MLAAVRQIQLHRQQTLLLQAGPSSALRAEAMTVKPWAPSFLAAARPMPLEQPVTRTKGWGMSLVVTGRARCRRLGMVTRGASKKKPGQIGPVFGHVQMPDYRDGERHDDVELDVMLGAEHVRVVPAALVVLFVVVVGVVQF